MAKEYHIVCGENSSNNLMISDVIDFSNENIKLITLLDTLVLGPLYDLKTLRGINERINWFEEFFQETDFYFHREINGKDIAVKLREITSGDSIFIWLGDDGNEYIWKAAILNFLKDISITIYTVDWQNIPFNSHNGYNAKLFSLYVCTSENIQLAKQYFRLITNNEKLFFEKSWEKFLRNNSNLRILNNQNQIEESDITYFDDILIANCTPDFQFSFKVIGLTIGNMYNGYNSNGIGDYFLIERLKQLCYEGLLQMRNQDHGQRNGHIFEVALAK
jgi:hypothetical protein